MGRLRRMGVRIGWVWAVAAMAWVLPGGVAHGAHSADPDGDCIVSLSELLRVIQFFNTGGLHCAAQPDDTEDGFIPGAGADTTCNRHDSDYLDPAWQVNLTELLRMIQFFNTGGYACAALPGQTEDDYLPGLDGMGCTCDLGGEGEGEGEGEPMLVTDANLEAALRDALGLVNEPLTPELLATVTAFEAPYAGISDITGLEHCPGLTELDLRGNCISDLEPLTLLTQLAVLNLHNNAITDVSPLASLTALRLLWLDHNTISDPAPLAQNLGLGDAVGPYVDRIALAANPLDAPGAADAIDLLEQRGVAVWHAPTVAAGEACAPVYEAGDPTPIGVRLIHGDPALDDARCYVMVCLGDAYTEETLDDYAHDVADVPQGGHPSQVRTWSRSMADSIRFMLSQEPFSEYAAYFKVYRVDLVSRAGELSDNRPDPPVVRDTALGMANESLAFSFDSEMVHRIANATGLPWDRIILMPNALGSGKNIDHLTMYSNARFSRQMTGLHELAHGIGGLTDEYEYRHGTNPPTPDPVAVRTWPNAISTGDRVPTLEEIPWKHWIEAACAEPDQWLGDDVDFGCVQEDCQCEYADNFVDCVPLPTCEPGGNHVEPDGKIYGRIEWPEPDETTPVGLYEGAWFRTKGAYRPELRCRMRSDDDVQPGLAETPRFCKVCREELNLTIVDDTGNAAAWTPGNGAPISIAAAGPSILFSLVLHTPATPQHLIEVAGWEVDGVPVPNETATTFMLDTATVDDGLEHTVTAILADRTAFVLPNYPEGQARLRQEISWALVP